jgi:hypothetical protein
MNYVSVVSVAASLLIAASWLGGGKKQSFTGPVMLGNILQGIDPGPNLGRNGKKALSHSKACEQDD